MGNDDDVNVNYVARPRSPSQRADLVRFVGGKGNDFAAA